MRALIQRVKEARVAIRDQVVGNIGVGLVVLLGITHEDAPRDADWLAEKICRLRIFPDDQGKMNRSAVEVSGELLVVSQFTLYGHVQRGLRPDFGRAAPASVARPLYEYFLDRCRRLAQDVQSGEFGADMDVVLTNWGPVTLWIDSERGH